jgi:hypothetical protein
MLGDLRKSFVGHPDALRFLANFQEASFSTATPDYTNLPVVHTLPDPNVYGLVI